MKGFRILFKVAAGLMFFLSFTSASQAACALPDIQKQWYAEYILKAPLQNGACIFELTPGTKAFVGRCYNATYDFYDDVTQISWNIQKSCRFKIVANFQDGQRLTASGKLQNGGIYGNGTVAVKNAGRNFNGTFQMWENSSVAKAAQTAKKILNTE